MKFYKYVILCFNYVFMNLCINLRSSRGVLNKVLLFISVDFYYKNYECAESTGKPEGMKF